MSANDDLKGEASPSLRISRAVGDLLESTGNVRAETLVAADSHANDTAFVAPSPLSWLQSSPTLSDGSTADEPDSADHPQWIGTAAASPRTGIIRTYLRDRLTDSPRRSDELAGLRFTHKDNIGIRDYPLTAGNPSLAHHRAQVTSPLLASIESAGGTIVGANHMAEFALSPTGHNHWLGNGVNPRNGSYLSGGSSSGSAIAVASGACDVSLGTDTGGSVRLPAAFCGVVGYKPSNGLFNPTGLIPLSETLDTIGIIAADVATLRTVADALFTDETVVSADGRARLGDPGASRPEDHKPSHLGEFAHLSISAVMQTCDPEVSGAYSTALTAIGLIDSAGRHPSVNTREVTYDDTDLNRRSVVVVSVEAARNVGRTLGWNWDLLGDQVLSRVSRGTAISAIEYADAVVDRATLQSDFIDSVMQGSRFLLTPTSPISAPRTSSAGNSTDPEPRSDYMRASRYTRTINYLGLPAISIPLPVTADSLAPGLQIIGRPFDDHALLEVAEALARMLD